MADRSITSTSRPVRRLVVLALCSLVSSATGCRKAPAPPPDHALVTHTYTVRGLVERIPNPSDPRAEFMVRHEEIPEFRAPGGVTGMKAMVMPFPVRTGVSLAGLSRGDAIELTFAVEYDEARDALKRYYVTAWKPLPPGTALDFSDRSGARADAPDEPAPTAPGSPPG